MDSGNEKRKEEREEEEIEEKVEGEFSTQHIYPQSLTFLRDLNTSILTIALSPISYHVYNCICHTGGAAVDEVKSDEEEELLEETKRSTKGERKRRRTETTETVSNHDSSSDGSRDVTLDESFEVGVKRERMGTEKGKRSRQHRSEEARMRRRTAAKERYKQNKLRRRLERASLNSPVKQPGESRKSPTTDGTPRSNLDRPASEGSGDVHRNPSGPGNQPPQAEPVKKLREEGPRSEGKRTSKDSACPPSKNPPPTKKPAGADAKPPRSGKRGARRGRPARPSGHPHHLYLRIEGTETATEVQRRSLMEYMAVTIASRPTSSTTRPVFITDSRLEPNGSIRLTGPDQETADNIREILEARGDVRFTEGPGVLRRFVFGGPGYLNNMTPEQIQGLLENQNPGLPQGSIRVVSVDTSGKNPLFFVEITEEGHAFLKERDFLLDSITSQMFFRPAGGKKRKDGSPDH